MKMGLLELIFDKPYCKLHGNELTELIDSSLRFVEELGSGTTRVFLVDTWHGYCVLKVGTHNKKNRKAVNHVDNEYKALNHLKEIENGIPLVHAFYENRTAEPKNIYVAVLKEFIQGNPEYLARKDVRFQRNMASLIFKICKKGIWLPNNVSEFKGNNIIVTKEQEPFLIDLGNAVVFSEQERATKEFKEQMQHQYHLFKKAYFPDV